MIFRRLVRLAGRTILIPICCFGLTLATAAGASDAFLEDAISELDFRSTQKADLESGKIISVGLPYNERQPTELMVGAAMMVVRRPLADVAQALISDKSFRINTEMLDFGTIGDDSTSREQIAEVFRGIGYSEAESDEATRLLQANAGDEFNLSQHEIDRFNALQAADGLVHEQVSDALADMLHRRFLDYLDGGLAAIEDYARTRGRTASPRQELTTAFDSLKLVKKHFPSFHASLTGFPAQVPADTANRFYWMKRVADKRPAFALSHRMVESSEEHTIAMDLQFYAQHSYNSMLTLVACLPVEQGTLVLSAVRVYTDQVTGFASGVRKEIGRQRVADAMTDYFGEVRRVLEAQ